MGHGLGMPRCLPRTKRTAKPQRDVYDVLAKVRDGVPGFTVEFNGAIGVTIRDGHRTVMVPREMYDRHVSPEGHTKGVHINIRVSNPE